MFSKIRARLSSAHLFAGVAVFLALGGTAVAAKDLISGKDIAKGTLTSKNVKDGTLKSKDLNKRTIASLQGPKGDTGAPGAPGAAGANGVVNPQSLAFDSPNNIAANTEVTVASKNVPSASYVVNASVDVFSQGAGIGGCNLLANGSTIDDAGFNETAGSVNTRTSLAFTGIAPAGTTTLAVSCGAGNSALSSPSVSLTAIPVG